MDCWDDHKNELPSWTPAPNPWRRVRIAAAGSVVGGVLAWCIWALVQSMPTISFDAFKPAAVAHVEAPKAPAPDIVEERPMPVQPVVATKPALKPGPVITDVTQGAR